GKACSERSGPSTRPRRSIRCVHSTAERCFDDERCRAGMESSDAPGARCVRDDHDRGVRWERRLERQRELRGRRRTDIHEHGVAELHGLRRHLLEARPHRRVRERHPPRLERSRVPGEDARLLRRRACARHRSALAGLWPRLHEQRRLPQGGGHVRERRRMRARLRVRELGRCTGVRLQSRPDACPEGQGHLRRVQLRSDHVQRGVQLRGRVEERVQLSLTPARPTGEAAIQVTT
ncbi:MAG: hypothetical protein JWO86_6193, partial [Myxococcaceae bacterium]|nr:hypothetical protein [Myxococcaceae bacterium]